LANPSVFFSLVRNPGIAFPMGIEQTIKQKLEKPKILKEETKKTQEQPNPEIAKKKRGRPKGSKNKDKQEVTLNSELLRIRCLINLAKVLIFNKYFQYLYPWYFGCTFS
jgi:hypothetical protein